jgi:hypothetical protein
MDFININSPTVDYATLEAIEQTLRHPCADDDLAFEAECRISVYASGRGPAPLEFTNGHLIWTGPDPHLPDGDKTLQEVLDHYAENLFKAEKLEKVARYLRDRPTTKRAVLSLWPNETDSFNAPFCLVYLWFRLRDNELSLHSHMRATDAYKKLCLNLHIFEYVLSDVAGRVGVDRGILVHSSDSCHIRASDEKFARELVERLRGTVEN